MVLMSFLFENVIGRYILWDACFGDIFFGYNFHCDVCLTLFCLGEMFLYVSTCFYYDVYIYIHIYYLLYSQRVLPRFY